MGTAWCERGWKKQWLPLLSTQPNPDFLETSTTSIFFSIQILYVSLICEPAINSNYEY